MQNFMDKKKTNNTQKESSDGVLELMSELNSHAGIDYFAASEYKHLGTPE